MQFECTVMRYFYHYMNFYDNFQKSYIKITLTSNNIFCLIFISEDCKNDEIMLRKDFKNKM